MLPDIDEIIILDDFSEDPITTDIFDRWEAGDISCTVHQRRLDGDFAAHKNYLNSLCGGDYIIQLDADELMGEMLLLSQLRYLIEINPEAEIFHLPRVNTVEGITQQDLDNYGWRVTPQGWIMWPDFQGRIYKNDPRIRWEGKVHERIVGCLTGTYLPENEGWAIIHKKTIDRQRKQNALYSEFA
jgi:hypothetical protein